MWFVVDGMQNLNIPTAYNCIAMNVRRSFSFYDRMTTAIYLHCDVDLFARHRRVHRIPISNLWTFNAEWIGGFIRQPNAFFKLSALKFINSIANRHFVDLLFIQMQVKFYFSFKDHRRGQNDQILWNVCFWMESIVKWTDNGIYYHSCPRISNSFPAREFSS